MDIPRQTYSAVVMALCGPFLVLIGALPYLFYLGRGVEPLTATLLVGLPVLAFFAAIIIGYFCGTSILTSETTIKTDTYIEAIALTNQVLLTILVGLTGGLTDSSFVSFMLLVPVLAMILGIRRRRAMVLLSTGLFIVLLIWKISAVQAAASNFLGTYVWLISFRASSVQLPHDLSTVWSLCITVWTTYLESTRAQKLGDQRGMGSGPTANESRLVTAAAGRVP